MATPVESRLPDGGGGRGFYDSRFDARIISVSQGAHEISGQDGEILSTILGSCVAACIRDPLLRIGGLNHFLLPGESGDHSGVSSADMRYGDAAMEILINALMRKGANRGRLEAKVFGGANVLAGNHGAVGQRNCQFVQDFLKHEGIPILAKDLGGDHPRRVNFDPYNGKVWVNHLDAPRHRSIAEQESRYREVLRVAPKSGGLEIF